MTLKQLDTKSAGLSAEHCLKQKKIFEKERIFVSERDCEIFFDAISNPKAPNGALTEAAKEFEGLIL